MKNMKIIIYMIGCYLLLINCNTVSAQSYFGKKNEDNSIFYTCKVTSSNDTLIIDSLLIDYMYCYSFFISNDTIYNIYSIVLNKESYMKNMFSYSIVSKNDSITTHFIKEASLNGNCISVKFIDNWILYTYDNKRENIYYDKKYKLDYIKITEHNKDFLDCLGLFFHRD